MTLTHLQHLNIPSLPPEACAQHLLPDMKTSGLLFTDQLWDAGCTAQLSQTRLEVRNKDGVLIIVGHRNHIHGNTMWIVNMTDDQSSIPDSDTCNAVVLSTTTKKVLAKLHHILLGFPVKSTLLNAIDKGFPSTFPGLTKKTG